jgi:hypothetical protein
MWYSRKNHEKSIIAETVTLSSPLPLELILS